MESRRIITPDEYIEETEDVEALGNFGIPARTHYNRHHILFYRREWAEHSEARALRGRKSLIPRLDESVHNALHDNFREQNLHVPILGAQTLNLVNRLYEVGGNQFHSIDNLLSSIDKAATFTPNSTSRELAELAIHTIQLQIPYIRDGLLHPADLHIPPCNS
ncbi:hypothetical protein FWD07_03045 [Candidatus Saccharibacteria bacterium]|nr:hypothetical protein [Candidatus Saccharibacteria bacterium]